MGCSKYGRYSTTDCQQFMKRSVSGDVTWTVSEFESAFSAYRAKVGSGSGSGADTSALEQAYKDAQSALESAKAAQSAAESKRDGLKSEYDGLIGGYAEIVDAKDALDAAVAAKDEAEGRLADAEGALESAKSALDAAEEALESANARNAVYSAIDAEDAYESGLAGTGVDADLVDFVDQRRAEGEAAGERGDEAQSRLDALKKAYSETYAEYIAALDVYNGKVSALESAKAAYDKVVSEKPEQPSDGNDGSDGDGNGDDDGNAVDNGNDAKPASGKSDGTGGKGGSSDGGMEQTGVASAIGLAVVGGALVATVFVSGAEGRGRCE